MLQPSVGRCHLGDDPISLVIGLFLLVLAIPFVVVAVVVALELLLLLLLLPFAILARIFFGRHWQVEIRRGFKPYWEEASGDWGASGRRIGVISGEIARGNLPPRTVS